ncbi:MAG: alpha/beta hydrolase-fold protein [Myxococcota bacterium]|nr:alpha/beta hydrolase-fold protein [Myxococcota bacterium]
MLWLLACTAPFTATPGPSVDSGEVGDTASDTADPTSADWEALQALLDGQATVEDTLQQISDGQGWPVQGPDGWVFVAQGDGALSWAGDASAWEPLEMTAGAGFSWIVVDIPVPQGSGYKFVSGDSYQADPWARAYTYDDFGELSFVRGSGGHLERLRNVSLAGRARTIRIWVPAQTPTHHLYAHDGQNLFDPSALHGGWRLQEAVASTTLVVGIDNVGVDRLDEYGPYPDTVDGVALGGGADALLGNLVTSLVPRVEEMYGAPQKRGMVGSSMGGLLSLYAGLTQAEHWDYVASLSGTLGWGSLELDGATLLSEIAGQDVAIYLDSGGHDGGGCTDSDGDGVQDDAPDADNYCVTRQMADALAADAWIWEQTLWHWHEAGAEHNEAAWAARVWRPVGLFETLE